MTVMELIEELQQYPLNNEVQLVGGDDIGVPVEDVMGSDDGKTVFIYSENL